MSLHSQSQANLQKFATEISGIIAELISTANKDSNNRDSLAAKRLAHYLSDKFADGGDENDLFARATREFVRRARLTLEPNLAIQFQDMIDVALARVDRKASMNYWMRDEQGKAITLSELQRFELDFIDYAHEEGLVAILFSPMASGKTSVLVGSIAYEIGKDQNTMEQLVAATDRTAEDRGNSVLKILESPHYQKIFPHIEKTPKWSGHKLLVKRSKADSNFITRDSDGDAGGVSPTLACYGATTDALGSRALFSNFDDLATYENSIKNPTDGKHITQILTTKFFSRKKAPIGVDNENYNRKRNPWRARIIGTPWAYDDPIYSLRDWQGAAVAVIGVDQGVMKYNVEIWGMPDVYIERLRQKYGQGFTEPCTLSPEMSEFCASRGLPQDIVAPLGPGRIVDKINPPKATMEIRLGAPREWYLEELKNAKDVRVDFDRPYRCQVFSEGELAYPGFGASLFEHYQDVGILDTLTGKESPINIEIAKEEIKLKRGDNANLESIGWRAQMINPPKNSGNKIACVDLSGMNREGCVITVATLTTDNRRRLDEIVIGRFAGEELPDEIGKVFQRHPDLLLCYIESVSMQDLYVRLIEHHKQAYPWWSKVVHWTDAAYRKNDQQVGILTMGVTFAHGGFEIPDTRLDVYKQFGHGYTCGCGYCVLIKDATMQTRLAPVKSDVLITVWGIHLNMPHAYDYGKPVAPDLYNFGTSGYGLMEVGCGSSVGEYIFGGASMAVPTERQKQLIEEEKQQIKDSENPNDKNQETKKTQRSLSSQLPSSPASNLLSSFGLVKRNKSDQDGWI